MPIEERNARMEALKLMQETTIIEFTHWTFDQLDEQDSARVNGMLTVLSIRGDLQRERDRRRK